MKKRYLKTVEDVIALKDTDTKIYAEWMKGYYKFVEGVLCYFNDVEDCWDLNVSFDKKGAHYILEEEPMQEATKEDVGKLGWFYDNTEKAGVLDFLEKIRDIEVCSYVTKSTNARYNHFRPLTPEEVEKYTGYKVVKED